MKTTKQKTKEQTKYETHKQQTKKQTNIEQSADLDINMYDQIKVKYVD